MGDSTIERGLANILGKRAQDFLFGPSLKAATVKGGLWTFGGFGVEKVLQLASNLILTRLLFPEAFGIMAIANVMVTALAMFSDVGIQPSIVQNRRGDDVAFLNTAWTIQIIRGFSLWTVAALIAWPVAHIYGQPILLPIICTIGSAAAINGFQTTAIATASRRIELGRLTAVRLTSQLIHIAAMVGLAWWLESVWALAIGNVIGAFVGTALGHLVLPSHRHRIAIDKSALDELISFGKWIFLTTLITFVGGRGLEAIQGLLVPVDTLGLIYIAGMLAWALGDLSSRLIKSVAFPALSRIEREEPHRFREIVSRVQFQILLFAIPGFVTLAFLSQWIIDLLYDERYSAAGSYLAVLSLSSAIGVLPMLYVFAFLARGDSRMNFLMSLAMTCLRVGGLLTGFYLGGILGMLAGIGVATLVYYFLVATLARGADMLAPRVDLCALVLILIAALIVFLQLSAASS